MNGKVPGGPEDSGLIKKLASLETRQSKERHTQLELGPRPDSEDVAALQTLVKALYLSWLHDVPLLMSA